MTFIAAASSLAAQTLNVTTTTVVGGNGNGIVDRNECNELTVRLRNNGTGETGDIAATLLSSTPGVTVTAPTSTYSSIADGTGANNSTLFQFSTAPDFVCGRPIDFVLSATTSLGDTSIPFRLETGAHSTVSATAPSAPYAIPDGVGNPSDPHGIVNVPLPVSGLTGNVARVTVALSIAHSRDRDLEISLIDPQGTRVALSNRNGGNSANYGSANCTGLTTFDDAAATTITAGSAPYNGTYKPEQPLATYAGKPAADANGTWYLRVEDIRSGSTGSVRCVTLNVEQAECTEGSGQCSMVDLTLASVDAPDPVAVNSPLSYTLTVANSGPSTATEVAVNGQLPAGVTFVSSAAAQGSVDISGSDVTWSVGTLAAGEITTLTLNVTPGVTGTISFPLQATAAEFETSIADNSIVVDTEVSVAVDLAVVKSAPASVATDELLTYTIVVSNEGTENATDVTVADVLPAGLAYVDGISEQGTVSVADGAVTAALGDLAAGQSTTVTLTAQPSAAGLITNTATVSAAQPDSDTNDNSSSAQTEITPVANLSVAKTASVPTVVNGGQVVYTITVANAGPDAATNVVVSDALPASVNTVATTATQGSVGEAGGLVTAELGTLAAGQTATVEITVATAQAGNLENTATVNASETDRDTADNQSAVSVEVLPGADLAVILSDSADPAPLGGDVTYTATVVNNGPDAATSVVLSLSSSSNLQHVTATASQGAATAFSPTLMTYVLGGLAADSSATVTLVTKATAVGTATVNAGLSHAGIADPDGSNNSVTEETQIAAANLVLAAATFAGGNGDNVIDGDECNNVLITLSNTGLFAAENVAATLSTNTPGVVITQPTSTYPNIAADGNGTNDVAFSVSTESNFVCGTQIELVLSVSTGSGNFTIPVEFESGVHSNLRFDNNDVTTVPDALGNNPANWQSVDIPFEVSGVTGNITEVTASLHLLHNQTKDVILEVIAPNGAKALLARQEEAHGVNYGTGCADEERTTFDDAAVLGIGAGSPPYVGTFRTEGGNNGLVLFRGIAATEANGTWTLRVTDRFDNNIGGTVQCSSLGIEWADCTAGLGACPSADLAISGTDTPDPATINHDLVYTFVVSNNGTQDATSVTATVNIPASATISSVVPEQGTTSQDNGTITWEVGSLASGAGTTITVTVVPTEVGTLSVTAGADTAVFERNPADNVVTLETAVELGADVRVSKTGPATVQNLTGFSYNVTVTNDGPDTATAVVLTDALPANVSFTTATADAGEVTEANGVVTVAVDSLAAGQTVNVAISVTGTGAGVTTNTAVVLADQADFDLNNNSSTAVTDITPVADVRLSKTANVTTVPNGGLFTYTLTVHNDGPDAAPAVTIEDELSSSVTYVGSTTTQGTVDYEWDPDGGCVTANLGEVASGGSAVVTIDVRATEQGMIFNTADVSTTAHDPNGANNAGTVGVLVVPGADVAVSVTNSPDPVEAGDETTYTIVAVNNGPDTATSSVLRFELPAEVTLTTATSELTTCTEVSSGVIECELGDLAVGSSVTVEVLAATTVVGTFESTATISSETADPAETNNVFVEPITVAVATFAPVSVSFVDADGDGRIEVGECATVDLTIENISPLELTSVTAALSSNTPGVVVTQSASEYPDLATSQTATNLTSFEICTSSTFVCGTPISLSLTLVSNEGAGTVNFAGIATGLPLQYEAGTGPIATPITDATGNNPASYRSTQIPVEVSGIYGNVTDLNVSLNITHPRSRDLRLSLTAPGASSPTVILVDRKGGGNAADFGTAEIPTTFDDASTVTIASDNNDAPFAVGTFQPQQSLTVFNGRGGSDLNGTWILTVTDTADGANTPTPTVNSVSLGITTAYCGDVADLSIEKSSNVSELKIGGNVVYTLTVTNNGPDAAENVIVTDVLTSATFVGANASVGAAGEANGTVTAELGTLAPGTSATVTIEVTPIEAGILPNTAAVSTDAADLNTNDNTDTVEVTVNPLEIDLAVEKTADVSELIVGGNVVYTITVLNNGPDSAAAVTLTDALPSGATYVSSSASQGTPAESNGTVTAELGALAANTSATVTITVTADAVGTLTNSATAVSADEEDTDNSNDTGTATVTVNPVPPSVDLQIAKSADVTSITVGGNVVYTLTVTNNGPDAATNVVVTDELDANATYVSGSSTAGTVSASNGTVTASIPSLSVGGSATVTITVTASAAGTLPNTATVDGSENDPVAGNNSASVSVTVENPIPTTLVDLAVAKSADRPNVANGGILTYTVLVTNAGPDDATSVTVFDPIDPSLTILGIQPSSGQAQIVNGTIAADLGAMAANTTATVVIAVRPTEVGPVLNTVFVAGAEADPTSENNNDLELVEVQPGTDIRVSQTASANPAELAEPLTFTVTVRNAGPDAATSVTLADTLPSGATFNSASLTKGTYSVASGILTAQIGTLAADEAVTLTLSVTPQTTATLTNVAAASAAETDLLPGNNLASLAVQVGVQFTPGIEDDMSTSAGWVPFGYEIPGFAHPQHNELFGAWEAHIAASPGRFRVTGVRSDGSTDMPYSAVGPNRFVRVKYYLYHAGQEKVVDIPAIRLRAAIRFAQTSLLEVFTQANADPGATPVSTELRPSGSSEHSSLYRVDFDPIDVPSLTANAANETIMRGFEAFTNDDYDHGYVAMAESVIGTYPVSALPLSVLPVYSYATTANGPGNLGLGAGPGAAVTSATLLFNSTPGAPATLAPPSDGYATHAEGSFGVTMATNSVTPDAVAVITREFDPGVETGRVRIEADKQYLVRFHATSTQPSSDNAMVNFRVRSARFSYVQRVILGGSHAASLANNQIAAESLPGVGSQNPDKEAGDTTGGWYNVLMYSPLSKDIRPEFPEMPLSQRMPNFTAQPGPGQAGSSMRDLRVGADLVDTLSRGFRYQFEKGHVTIDRIQVRVYDAIAD